MEYMEDLDIVTMGIIIDEWNPKNKQRPIIKGSDGEKKLVVKGLDGIKGLLFGTVVTAAVIDDDDQGITNDEVEKSCWNYQQKLIEKGFDADLNHNKKLIEGVKIVENHVNRNKDLYSHDIVLDFSGNAVLMEKAKKGKINGLSPAGRARIVEKGAFEAAFDKIAAMFKGVKTDFDRDIERSKMWRAFDVFRTNVAKYVFNPEKGYEEERIVVEKAEYDTQVDELAQILKDIDLEKINKGVPDMKQELKDLIATDEGKKELEALGFVEKAKPETSEETPAKQAAKQAAEPEKAPETITKAEFDAYKTEQDAKVADLKTQLIEVAKGRATGADELAPEIDVNKMTEEQLKDMREKTPDLYKAALDKAAKKK